MNYFVKKPFEGGFISVRDYFVTESLRKNEPLVIYYNGKKMTIDVDELAKRGSHFVDKKFKSKINSNQEYQLVDFYWSPEDVESHVRKSKDMQMGFDFDSCEYFRSNGIGNVFRKYKNNKGKEVENA